MQKKNFEIYAHFTFHNAQVLDCKIPFANDLIAQLSGAGFIWIAVRFALGTVGHFQKIQKKKLEWKLVWTFHGMKKENILGKSDEILMVGIHIG